MKKIILITLALIAAPLPARANLWGGDLPLLAQIVFNTLQTLYELKKQSDYLHDEMDGVQDRIERIQTIASVIQPSSWDQWRNPAEAMRRLKLIYHTLPPEYRSAKSDTIEDEISKAMNMVSRLVPEANTTFLSGKELELRGADSSPGVAAKLTASGVGTLVAMEAQTQVIQSHITSLLAQTLADANEKENRSVMTKGAGFSGVSASLGNEKGWFSNHVFLMRWR